MCSDSDKRKGMEGRCKRKIEEERRAGEGEELT